MLTPVDPKCAVFHFIYLSLHSEINKVTKQSGIKIAVRRLDVFSAKSGDATLQNTLASVWVANIRLFLPIAKFIKKV